MPRPNRLAYYNVRDMLAALRGLAARHQEESQGTELFVALEELRIAIDAFEEGPAVKRLQSLHLEEFHAAQRPSN